MPVRLISRRIIMLETPAMKVFFHGQDLSRGSATAAVFLQHIPTANVTSESDRGRWTAEAHVLRAYYYSELLMWFGCSLPIIREPYTLDADFAKVERSSFHDVVEFVIEDCDAALACDDLPWRITTDSEAMRMTKAVAWAIKSRMTLFAASPLYNEGNNYWEEAYSVNKAGGTGSRE